MVMIVFFASNLIVEILDTINLDISELSTYSPVEYFKTKIFLSLVLSLIFSTPLWLLCTYNFSKTGLTDKERSNIGFTLIAGQTLFLTGCVIGFYFLTPLILDFLLSDNELILQNLSIYETIKIIVSITLFTGLLISTPSLTLLVNRLVEDRNDIRKYIYTLILFIAIIATPKPSMILNVIFLVSFVVIAEMTLILTGAKDEN